MNEFKGELVPLTFGPQVFAAVLELDEFLKQEEEERRQKEKKVNCTSLQTNKKHTNEQTNKQTNKQT